MREALPDDQRLSSFTAANGETIEFIVDITAGADHPVLVYHHGTPGAGPIDADLLKAARTANLRTVELVRPGYGGTRVPGRTVASNAARTAALVEHLGAAAFVSCGWSGGGPHTLADVALLENCAGSVSIAGVAPFDADGIDFLAGMGQDNLEEFDAAKDPERLRPYLEAAMPGLANVTNATVRDALGSLLPPADLRHLEHSTSDVAAALRWSVADGIWGWYDDDIAFVRPWGFDLARIFKPVTVLQGSEDLMVPFAHGEWLAAHIPGATAALIAGEGHLSIGEQHLGLAVQRLADLLSA